MKRVLTWCVIGLLTGCVTTYGATILHYDFEDGTPETPMNNYPVTQQNGMPGTADLSGNGYAMHAWDDYWGPMFSASGQTPTGAGLSSMHDGHRDGYTLADGIRAWSPSTWTIELSFKLDDVTGWRTMIGRDDWAQHNGTNIDVGAAFYIQKNGENNAIRLNYATVSGERISLDASLVPQAGQWYRFAIVADGDQVDMYANQLDGNGFQNVGSFTLDAGVDHSLLATGNWTFGRGWWNGGFVDHIAGNLDDIRFSDEALTTDQFIPEPATLALLGLGALMLRRRK
ncbi:MAG: PEP-CTERM sorting domain-containing protein [Phycisphaerae bacterium]|nr:PEP-CTERM sorting domain-containing protein [Phycisphaerae bacterium]